MTKELQQVQQNVGKFLMANKAKIATALPKHITPERMLSIVMTEVRKNPELSKCNQQSLISAVIQCSQLGLEPGNSLGHAYLIPFKNKKQDTIDCQFIIGYRGMIDLARRSREVISISAHVVYENDTFEFEYGLNENLRHIPTANEPGEIIAFYSIAKFKDGGHQIEVMWKREVDKIRSEALSKIYNDNAKKYSPWTTSYVEMGKKTVIRRIFKFLPVSIEIQKLVMLDESADRGEQRNDLVIDGEFDHVTGEIFEPKPESKADALSEKLSKQATVETPPPNDGWDELINEGKANG